MQLWPSGSLISLKTWMVVLGFVQSLADHQGGAVCCGVLNTLGKCDMSCFLCLLQVKVLLGHRVVQVACGSRDAQTLALTDEGI